MKARSILASLVALAAGVSADSGGTLPSSSFPALTAAPLVYSLVPDPLGAGTWAEQQIEEARLGIGSGTPEEVAAADALLALGGAPAPTDYALDLPVAPPDLPDEVPPGPAFEAEIPDDRLELGALEAMGLTPADLVEAPEMPPAAHALAGILERVDALVFGRGSRRRGSEVISLRVDPESRYAKQPSYVRYKKPLGDTEPKDPPLTLHAKRVTRSLYKVLLGVAIGILIWACGVRPPPHFSTRPSRSNRPPS